MNLEYFLKQLGEQTTPMNKNTDFATKSNGPEKISLNFEGNFGRYQILPFDSVVQDIPFIKLWDTKEICVPRMGKNADGTPNPYKTWIKLLPVEGYKMQDSTGRVVSSLTAEEEDMLKSARTLFDQLYTELDVKNNIQYSKDVARKRNYTIFHAYCMNRWAAGDSRTPVRSNFCGLFVCTAKGFISAVEENVSSKALLTGGDQTFLKQIYNRDLTGRTGFVLFTIGKNPNQAGYQVNIQHEYNVGATTAGITITQEQADMMKDPVANFLGWQAAKEEENVPAEQRRLFNKTVIGDAINFMTKQLTAIRAAKQSGTDINEAMRITNEMVLSEIQNNQPQTNDPMLQAQASQGNTVNPDLIKNQNTQPFQTPPAAKMSPITGAPEPQQNSFSGGFGSGSGFGGFGGGNQQSTPSFTSPFGNFNNQSSEGDLPF
jgi:hypothetical protein